MKTTFAKEEEKKKVKVLDYHFHSDSSLNPPHSIQSFQSVSPTRPVHEIVVEKEQTDVPD